MKASHILVLVVVALAVMPTWFASTASQVSVRFRIVSDVNVTKYHVDALAGYEYFLAIFVRDGVLYIAYDNSANGSNIVRVDTGEIVKVCSFSNYIHFDSIVAGRGTAYGVMNYGVRGSGEWGTKIIDLWSCEVLAVFKNARIHYNRFYDALFRYDMYSDKLLYVFSVYDETIDAELNYVALIDVATRDVKELFLDIFYNYTSDELYVVPLGLYVGPDYYYVITEDYRTDPPAVTMYIYDKDLEVVRALTWDPNVVYMRTWYGLSDIAINTHGVLWLKLVQKETDLYFNFWYKLVACDPLLGEFVEYATDADDDPTSLAGVIAYKDLFVFHNGKSAYSGWVGEIPYAFLFLPGIGLAVNTSIAGSAIPVDYELWSNNRVVLFNPATGDVYLVDPPAVTYTVTETVTAPVAFTTTVTETATVTMPPPSSSIISPLVPLLLIIAITAGIIGFMKASARSVLKHTLDHAMMFVKKKQAYQQ